MPMTLGDALLLSAETLPEGWIVRVEVEKGAGWVTLLNPDGDQLDVDHDEFIANAVLDAIKIAKGEELD